MFSMSSVKIRDSDLFFTLHDKSGVMNKTKKKKITSENLRGFNCGLIFFLSSARSSQSKRYSGMNLGEEQIHEKLRECG